MKKIIFPALMVSINLLYAETYEYKSCLNEDAILKINEELVKYKKELKIPDINSNVKQAKKVSDSIKPSVAKAVFLKNCIGLWRINNDNNFSSYDRFSSLRSLKRQKNDQDLINSVGDIINAEIKENINFFKAIQSKKFIKNAPRVKTLYFGIEKSKKNPKKYYMRGFYLQNSRIVASKGIELSLEEIKKRFCSLNPKTQEYIKQFIKSKELKCKRVEKANKITIDDIMNNKSNQDDNSKYIGKKFIYKDDEAKKFKSLGGQSVKFKKGTKIEIVNFDSEGNKFQCKADILKNDLFYFSKEKLNKYFKPAENRNSSEVYIFNHKKINKIDTNGEELTITRGDKFKIIKSTNEVVIVQKIGSEDKFKFTKDDFNSYFELKKKGVSDEK